MTDRQIPKVSCKRTHWIDRESERRTDDTF